MSASIIRSVAMFTAISIGMASDRPTEVKNSLIISLFFLLLLNPYYLFDVGFQLSYTAVFSIVWLQPVFSGFWTPKQKLLRYFWNLLTVTFAAQLGILPLTLFYFHQFPGLFFVSSLIILPFLGIILGFGFLIIFLALLHILPQFMADLYELILKTMNNFVAFISFQEEFVVKNSSMSLYLLLACYVLIIGGVMWLKSKSIKSLYLFLVSVLIFQIILTFEKFKTQNSNQFIVFHQTKNTAIGNRLGENFVLYKSDNKAYTSTSYFLDAYKNSFPNLKFEAVTEIKNILRIGSKNVLIIDSSAIYTDLSFNPEIVILINSPKVNMDRMIDLLHPTTVIADGSNYRSYALKWGESCKENAIQFYNTSVDGAFVYNYTP